MNLGSQICPRKSWRELTGPNPCQGHKSHFGCAQHIGVPPSAGTEGMLERGKKSKFNLGVKINSRGSGNLCCLGNLWLIPCAGGGIFGLVQMPDLRDSFQRLVGF